MGNNAQNPVDDESDMQVTLSLDDGSEVECAILTIFELEEQNYIALLPLDDPYKKVESDHGIYGITGGGRAYSDSCGCRRKL